MIAPGQFQLLKTIVKMRCPECQAEIPLADVNVSTDKALCRRCGKNFSYAEVTDETTTAVDLAKPPAGAWARHNPHGFEIGASLRSGVAFFLVPFMCLWSGGSLIGIYGGQIRKGQFDLTSSLFGLPFLLGSVVLGAITLLAVFGKVTVRVQDNLGTVFMGVGSVGWRKRFQWDKVTDVGLKVIGSSNGQPMRQIVLQADHPVHVGFGINKARQQFMVGALRAMLRERK